MSSHSYFGRLTAAQRWKIVFLKQEMHLSNRFIAARVRCSPTTVAQVLSRYHSTGDTAELHRSGRPNVLNTDQLAVLERIIIKNPSFTARALANELFDRIGIRVLARTIRRYRRTLLGFHSVHERVQQSLTSTQMAARVAFANTHRNNDWKYVLFSDEKLFMLKNTGTVVWVRPGDEIPTRQVSDIKASIMVWGCVWWSGKTSLWCGNESINRHTYCNILGEHLLPEMPTSSRYQFQQDNAPAHKARYTTDWLTQHAVDVLPGWPAHSPEFNAIEYVWSWMTSYVNMEGPKNKNELERAIQMAWTNIPQYTVQAYISHIHTVCAEVIATNGDHV